MIKRILFAVIGLAILGAAAATVVVALAFALYASLKPEWGPAGASAATAGAAALLALVLGLVFALMARGGRRPAKAEPSIGERIGDFARERPVIAAAGALAAGLIALKNPKLAAGLASAFMAGKAADKAEKSRRRW